MGTKYKQSPIGIARHSHCNKPDTKYNADGVYHTKLVVSGEEAEKFKAEVDAYVDAAWDTWLEEQKQKNAKFNPKPWTKYYPYEVEEEEGAPTGNIIFMFKQNAKIKLKDGSVKNFVLGIRDAKNKATTANVFGGDTIRTLYAPRDVVMSGIKQVGVRLDYSMVQLVKKAPMQGAGFDEVDGEYTDDAGDNGGSSNEDAGEEY